MADAVGMWEGVVVTPENELAVRAARNVADAPGAAYNPLIIQGPKGSGKTHLLNAIAAHAAADARRSILRRNAEEIAGMLADSTTHGTLPPLREALSGVDLLLIDDIHRLEGQEHTEEELGEALARTTERGAQVVLTSLRSPAVLARAGTTLRRVLTSGLSVELEPMGSSAREKLVRVLAERYDLQLPLEVAAAIGERGSSDLGRLEQLVWRLATDAREQGRLVTTDDLYALLGNAGGDTTGDEFAAFLDDVTRTLSVVVERAPWRRRIAESIVRWEAEGLRTRRLDEALELDTPPDVDALLEGFSRDATRLLEIRQELSGDPDVGSLDDPDDLARAESLLRRKAAVSAQPLEFPGDDDEEDPDAAASPFFDPRRSVLDWTGVEERIAEGTR